MQQLLIQFPIKQDKKEIWISLLNSKIGLPYTKTMDGFISAEHGISKNTSGVCPELISLHIVVRISPSLKTFSKICFPRTLALSFLSGFREADFR